MPTKKKQLSEEQMIKLMTRRRNCIQKYRKSHKNKSISFSTFSHFKRPLYKKIETNYKNETNYNMELTEYISKVKQQHTRWKDKGRIAGEACEEYIKNNIKCVRCNDKNYEKCKTNEKSIDLICINCKQKFQIKGKGVSQKGVDNIKNKNEFKTIGASYPITIQNIDKQIDYLIILYEKQSYKIINILYIKYENINSNCIISRKPLSTTAKRAGWHGCNILFTNIQFII